MLQPIDLIFLKESHPGHKIIYLIVCGKEFVFRTLGKKEYKNILSICSNEYELEEMMSQMSLLFPDDYDFKNAPHAGICKIVAPIVAELSGFTNPDVIVEYYNEQKNQMATFENQCHALIKAAFPEFTFEEMEEWTWEKMLGVATKAEYILNLRDPSNEIQLVSTANTENEEEKPTMHDMANELRLYGIDPMEHFWGEINHRPNYMDYPLIGGAHWQNEGILDEIRRQVEKRPKR